MRMIDVDALKEKLNEVFDTVDVVTFDDIIAIIDNAPTVVNEYTKGFSDGERSGRHFPLTDEEKAILVRQWRPQGEWIFKKANEEQTDGYECSNCKACFHTKVPYFSEFNFCPNCGAKMEQG